MVPMSRLEGEKAQIPGIRMKANIDMIKVKNIG